VAWSPSVLSKSYIASASQDKTVKIWTTNNVAGGKLPTVLVAEGSNLPLKRSRLTSNPGEWQSQTLNFDAVAWRVSWSLTGNVLAVSTGNNKVTLWKERLSGGWEKVQTIEE
jgi:protein transport protein SEC13